MQIETPPAEKPYDKPEGERRGIVIVNTGAIIEHDAVIGRSCHISVGAKLAGEVAVGQGTHVGIGATIIQGIQIGENCIIGAGAVVIRDVPDNHMAVGVPAQNRPIES